MRRVLILAVITALATARPELYREKEDFQFSRSSSDDGTKSGFYGAQRGNMGGNYERAHNMDTLAQNQMSGLVRTVQGELGEATKENTGSVFTAANSRGIYGSGNFDLSNLQGRNFQEGTSYGDLQSLSSHALSSQAGQSYSASNTAGYGSSNAYNSRYSGYRSGGSSSQSLYNGNLQATDNLQASNHHQGNYAYNGHSSGGYSQAAYHGQSGFDQSGSSSDLTNEFRSGIRLVPSNPVKIVVRPGERVYIPVAAQTFDATQDAYDRNAINNHVVGSNDHQGVYRPTTSSNQYESSYRYRKEWEKHDTKPIGAVVVPVAVPPINPYSSTDELQEEVQASGLNHEASAVNSARFNSNNRYSRYNTKSLSSRGNQQATYDALQNNAASSLSSTVGSGIYSQGIHDTAAANMNGQVDLNSKPKSYQSAYSYHKSWERQGDPYVIIPATNGVYSAMDGQASQRLTASSNQAAYGKNYHQGHASNTEADSDCDIYGHNRVARSVNHRQMLLSNQNHQNVYENQERLGQQSQKLEDFSQQENPVGYSGQHTQNHWDQIEDLGQHAQKLEDLGQQTQSHWDQIEDASQQTQKLEDLGQQTQSHWDQVEDAGQQTQKLEDLGQQTQSQWSQVENTGQQAQKLEDLGQQTQSHWDQVEDAGQQTQKLENLGQQTQSQWSQVEDVGQQTQNLEDLGQQTQSHWGQVEDAGQQTQKFEDLGQNIQSQWDKIQDFGQQQHNHWNPQETGQQIQNTWDKLDTAQHIQTDLGQHTQDTWSNLDTSQKETGDEEFEYSQHRTDQTQSHGTQNTLYQTQDNTQEVKHPLVFNRPLNLVPQITQGENHHADLPPKIRNVWDMIDQDPITQSNDKTNKDQEKEVHETTNNVHYYHPINNNDYIHTSFVPKWHENSFNGPYDHSLSHNDFDYSSLHNIGYSTSIPTVSSYGSSHNHQIWANKHSASSYSSYGTILQHTNSQTHASGTLTSLWDKIDNLERQTTNIGQAQSTDNLESNYHENKNTFLNRNEIDMSTTKVITTEIPQLDITTIKQHKVTSKDDGRGDIGPDKLNSENLGRGDIGPEDVFDQFSVTKPTQTVIKPIKPNRTPEEMEILSLTKELNKSSSEVKHNIFESSNKQSERGLTVLSIDEQKKIQTQNNWYSKINSSTTTPKSSFSSTQKDIVDQNRQNEITEFNKQTTTSSTVDQHFKNQGLQINQQNFNQFEDHHIPNFNSGQQNIDHQMDEFGQENININQQSSNHQIVDYSQENINLNQQNMGHRGVDFGQENVNLNQQSMDDQLVHFGQENIHLDQQNVDHQGVEFGEKNINLDQQSMDDQLVNFDQENIHIDQQNMDQGIEFGQENVKLDQQSMEHQIVDFGQENVNLDQQSMDHQVVDFGQENVNLDQQSMNQVVDFGQENVNLDQQRMNHQVVDFGQENINLDQQSMDHQVVDFGQANNHNQQSMDHQIVNFGKEITNKQNVNQQMVYQQNVNLNQQTMGDPISHFGQPSKHIGHKVIGKYKLDQQTVDNPISGFSQENMNLGQETQNLESFGQPDEALQQESLNHRFVDFNNPHEVYQHESFSDLGQKSETFMQNEQQFENWRQHKGKTFENIDQQVQKVREPSELETQQVQSLVQSSHLNNVNKEYGYTNINQPVVPETVTQKSVKVESALEPVTEKPGFWKSVGSKFVSAKDKVKSWFSSS